MLTRFSQRPIQEITSMLRLNASDNVKPQRQLTVDISLWQFHHTNKKIDQFGGLYFVLEELVQ
jgi:hypothetical protein